jgi:hypothetical protein
MKKIILLIIVLSALKANSQSSIVNDTLIYQSLKFTPGDTIQLWYGSGNGKNFAFVYVGSGMTGVTLAQAGWSKSLMKIDKVYVSRGKNFMRGRIINAGAMFGNKLFIDVEGAVDNNEIKAEK